MKSSRYPEAAFLSAMTASATHEVRNVLAIIKESAGLIEDMVLMCSKGKALDEEKVGRAVERVDAQVKRGAGILTSLNRLSHCLDVEVGTVDLSKELEQILFLSKRMVRNRRQELVALDTEGEWRVTAHPLHLQMALFAVIETCAEGYPEGTSISARIVQTGPTIRVDFRGKVDDGSDAPFKAVEDGWGSVEQLVSAVGGGLEILKETGGIRVSFSSE